MSNVTVVGAQWGDEGKGKIVDWLSERAEIVVRFQGGHNAGHTLVVGESVFKLSLLPSGVVRPGKVSVIGNGVVVDPWALLAEIERVRGQGVAVTPQTLRVAENVALILPLHGELDRMREESRGERKLGTTGRGIGPAYEDKVARRAIRLCDLADEASLDWKLEELLRHHDALRRGMGAPAIDRAALRAQLVEVAPKVLEFAEPVWMTLDAARRAGKRILFEGAQAAMLDVDHGTYPYVTSSNTTAGGACTGSGVPPHRMDKVVGVMKAYTTRVGEGPLPTENAEISDLLHGMGREFGATTGRARRCGWFDAVATRHATMVNGIDELAVTNLDGLDTLASIKVCVGYRVGQVKFDHIPNDIDVLALCEPVYEERPGWQVDTSKARKWKDLPPKARDYLKFIAAQTGAKLAIASVGPGRDQTIFV